MALLEDFKKEAKLLHDRIINEMDTTTEQFSKWVRIEKNIKGFSPPTISNIYNGKSKNLKTIKKYCKLCEEYLNSKHVKEEDISNKFSNKSKLSLYLNRNYFLYYFETRKAQNENFIGCAILKIGPSENEISIDNNIGDETSTDYLGTIAMHPRNENHIILRLQTTNFKEKDLKIIFRITKDKETPMMMGGYMNIDKSEAIVMGTILAVQTKETELKAGILKPNSPEYKNLNPHIKNFFRTKEKNFIKIRNKGIFNDDDFLEFFKDQLRKPLSKSTTGAGRIFLAYPMSSIKNFTDLNVTIDKIYEDLQKIFDVEVFYAGKGMMTASDFDPASIATDDNFEILKHSDRFLMIYPEKVASSCLIELGYAIAEKKPCTIFYKKIEDLPYMVQEANMLKRFQYTDEVDLLNKIKKVGLKLF